MGFIPFSPPAPPYWDFPSGSCFPVLDVAVGEGGTPGVVRREVPEVLQGQRGPVADAELFVLLRPTGSKGRGHWERCPGVSLLASAGERDTPLICHT